VQGRIKRESGIFLSAKIPNIPFPAKSSKFNYPREKKETPNEFLNHILTHAKNQILAD
jgi:hypothetical protein